MKSIIDLALVLLLATKISAATSSPALTLVLDARLPGFVILSTFTPYSFLGEFANDSLKAASLNTASSAAITSDFLVVDDFLYIAFNWSNALTLYITSDIVFLSFPSGRNAFKNESTALYIALNLVSAYVSAIYSLPSVALEPLTEQAILSDASITRTISFLVAEWIEGIFFAPAVNFKV